MPFLVGNYYYLIIILQAICVIHCLRKGKEQKWIWLIVFLPLIGCIAYIFTEMFSGNEIQNVQAGVSTIVNPTGKIKKLEKQLQFSDTFNNRVLLADAYLAAGNTGKAIELYKSSLTGNFSENEHVIAQLIVAYCLEKNYAPILPLARKIYHIPQFARSKAHIAYAIALEHTGNTTQAEQEYNLMKARFANFEARYHYGLFLVRNNRANEAKQLFSDIAMEEKQLSSRERRYNRQFIQLAKDELRRLQTMQTAS